MILRQRERERESKSVKSSDFAESSAESSPDSANRAKFAESKIFQLLSQPINSLHAELFATNSCAFLPKLYGIWEGVEKIEFEKLPKAFVLKTNHDSGGVVLVSDKEAFLNDSHTFKNAMKKLNKHLKTNYYQTSREWHYKDIEARVFAEELLGVEAKVGNKNFSAPQDYRFFTFDKNNMFIQFDYGKYWYFYDKNWQFQHFSYKIPVLNDAIAKPQNLALMREIASNLAHNFTRVDLYEVNGYVFVGELTWTPNGGTIKWNPPEWDKKLGDLWK